MFNPHGYYSYREVCELTTLSRPTIYRLRKKNLFPDPDPLTGRRVGWPIPVIHRWLAARSRREPVAKKARFHGRIKLPKKIVRPRRAKALNKKNGPLSPT